MLSHQQAINLTEQQRQTIQSTMFDTQKKLLDQRIKLEADVEKLQSLLRGGAPDEARVLDEMDRVLGAERDVKRAQLGLMVKLKNSLTPQQQSARGPAKAGAGAVAGGTSSSLSRSA